MEINKLTDQCKKRNSKAEKELFFRFAPKVLSICRRYAAHDEQAQDYLQECFLLVFESIGKFDPQKGEFAGWLYRVCTNVVLSELKKEKKRPQLIYMDQVPEVEDPGAVWPEIPEETLIAAIQQLPAGYREVFNLYVFEEWSHREIAGQLGITESASRSQLARAKKLLKKFLNPLIPISYGQRLA